ncbi:MAG TPA: hypothetical protein VHS09_03930, partial [Polyangiaceae bacterium]|nr:hypothetical protein [Polyangiaceae bacterium]
MGRRFLGLAVLVGALACAASATAQTEPRAPSVLPPPPQATRGGDPPTERSTTAPAVVVAVG